MFTDFMVFYCLVTRQLSCNQISRQIVWQHLSLCTKPKKIDDDIQLNDFVAWLYIVW